MNEDFDLKQALGRLREQSPQSASTATEARLLQTFRARNRRNRWLMAARYAAAACLVIALVWLLTDLQRPPAPGAKGAPAAFMQLPYGQSEVPLEDAVIVHVELQPSELESMGLRLNTSKAGRKIPADLLVGQDGVARAVRLSQ
jgi:negative regulator of sigma E activity